MNSNPFPSRYLVRRVVSSKQGIAAVDDDVPLFQVRQHLLDQLVHRLPGLDHEHHPPGPFQQRGQFRQRMGADHFGPLGLAPEEFIDPRHRPVENGHDKTVVVHVENEVLAHHGQSDQSDVCLSFHEFAPLSSPISGPAITIPIRLNIQKPAQGARIFFGTFPHRLETKLFTNLVGDALVDSALGSLCRKAFRISAAAWSESQPNFVRPNPLQLLCIALSEHAQTPTQQAFFQAVKPGQSSQILA